MANFKFMKSRLLLLLLILSLSGNSFAQRYVVDTTFTPFFDFYPMGKDGEIYNIWESPINGKLWILGDFDFTNGVRHGGITSIDKDGSRNLNFVGGVGGSNILPINDSLLLWVSNFQLRYLKLDTTGTNIDTAFKSNYQKTVRCSDSPYPYIFEDGSILTVNSFGNFGACDIINPPDTFPHRYIIKVTPDGLWDSTFTHESNDVVQGFLPYDSNRIWVYGKTFRFMYYDSVYVHGLCRIYTDGRLDTTFKNPFQDSTSNFNQILLLQPTLSDGDVLVSGQLYLKGDTAMHTLVRLNADGSLDTNFRNFESPKDTALNQRSIVYSAVPTADGGFLVGGGFNNYQGQVVNCIAKIDSTGKVEPSAIPFHGPDSSAANGTFTYPLHYIFKIIPSKFGGYYVVGDFKLWDSLPTNPIKRLVLDKTVSLNEELRITNEEIRLYPNPTNGILNIRLSQKAQIKEIRLFDLIGKEQATKLEQNQLDLSPLSKGIYFLQLQLNNGETLSRKIIKQ